MKTVISFHQLATKVCSFLILALIINAAPALAYQQQQQSEIRYIDRSKGERNIALPVYQPASETTGVDDQTSEGTLLWRIEHANNTTDIRSSYIFGTIHIDDERVMNIPDNLVHRVIAADVLMLELELNDNSSVDMLRKMLFTDGRNLSQVLGEQDFKNVSDALLESGNHLPVDVLTVLKPWAAMLLLIKPENKSGTFLDKKLASLARSAGVRVQGLETVNEQLSVFDDIAIDDQVSLLQSTMSTLNEKETAYQQMLDAYLTGNLSELVKISDSQLPEDKRLAEMINTKLIAERNQLMFNRMQQRLQAGNTFIAIGALHLAGKQGLLDKLRGAGYRLTRIRTGE
ncbi:MAG: TraB/GumN family protein [Gammaproteobacteria bacterium]|nr:TraB/GumN family protein [Gammaproteobacteria bacterium]